MPPALRTSYLPLDVDAARAAAESGRTVRIGILPTHQFPEGGAGRIKRVGHPDTDGPEFIFVEVTVGGAKDVVPFAPADLSPIRRSQAAPEPLVPPTRRRPRLRSVGSAVSAPAAAGGTAPLLSAVPKPVSAAVPKPESAAVPKPVSAAVPKPESAAVPAAVSAAVPAAVSSATGSRATTVAAPTAPVRKSPRSKRQPITVTLATIEPDHTSWQVEVTVGSRTVVKPSPIHPAQAWSLVTDLGHPEVARVVAGALNEHRQQAQERADRLARELAEARADLASYPAF